MSIETKTEFFVGRIPIRNIWALMAYAGESRLGNKTGRFSALDETAQIPDLIAELLIRAVDIRLKRGLSLGYVYREADLNRIRGKLDLLTTDTKLLLQKGRARCRYQELSFDTPRNQFVVYALTQISKVTESNSLARTCLALAHRLIRCGVTLRRISIIELAQDQLGRHDAADREMIELAKMAIELTLPSENAGRIPIKNPEKEDWWIRRLFEKAVAGFYRHTLDPKLYKVRTGTVLDWPAEIHTPGLRSILPTMRLDITIESEQPKNKLVIDTKFTEIVTDGWMRTKSLKSAYLYQIYTYLRSQESADPISLTTSGLILHPAIEDSYFESMTLQGHKLSFATIDLTTSISEIKDSLKFIFSRAL
jgi:5-methylcytosine-specific restriction enzyme subunit McrC